jgi:hypothetical protein
MDTAIPDALGPIFVLVALAILAAIASKAVRISPIVRYLLLGVALKALHWQLVTGTDAVATLGSLGVMFLLFELGLHFKLTQIRERAAEFWDSGPSRFSSAPPTWACCGGHRSASRRSVDIGRDPCPLFDRRRGTSHCRPSPREPPGRRHCLSSR